MNLRERLLFLFIPLIILPLVLFTVVGAFLFGKVTNSSLAYPYTSLALVFTGVVAVAVIVMVVNIANSISKPLKLLTGNARKIADGDLETSLAIEAPTDELDQLASAIEQMKKDLKRQREVIREEAANAAIGKLATHVAHDLASPLSSMQASLEYFKDLKVVDSKTSDYVNLLELSSKRLKAIAKELLDQRKGKEPKKILFSMHKVLDELIGEYTAQAEFNGVEFVKRYSSQAISIFGDRAKIQRAFGNLIKNSVEAMDKYGTLTIKTDIVNEGAEVVIEDTGCGMGAEILQKVLGEGNASFGKQGGHGIGLSVVKATIAEHKGKLEVTSEVGIGTTFRIELSLPQSVEVKGADREEDIVETFTIYAEKGQPVIVIDDDVGFLEQWRLQLEQKERETLLYASYEDFVSQRITPRLSSTVIVDYHFENSEMNGLQMIEKLKAQGFKNLYLCTAEYWKPSLKKQAEVLGVKVCPKPLPKIRIQKEQEGQGYKVLVIDDDKGIRACWELMQEKLGIEVLLCHPNLESLMASGADLSIIDIAFVDKNIEDSRFNGADVVSYLKSNQVGKIVLASGENEETLRQDPKFSHADFIVSEKIPTSFKEFFS